MIAISRRRLLAILALVLCSLASPLAGSALGAEPQAAKVTLSIGQPARFGEELHLGARLVDGAGAPIPNAKLAFVIPSRFFLGVTSDVAIAEVVTNQNGVAEADYEVRDSGWLSFRVDFRGSERYTAARSTAKIMVEDAPRQLHSEHAGVALPILNAPPDAASAPVHGDEGAVLVGQQRSIFAGLWPSLSVWPLALVLLILWSLYAFAVGQVFAIARAGEEERLVPGVARGPKLMMGGSPQAGEDDTSHRWKGGPR